MVRFLQITSLLVVFISCARPTAEIKDTASSSQTHTDIEEATKIDLFICKCSYVNNKTGAREYHLDTLDVNTLEEAELECSNYETTDDPDESIGCEVVVE